MRTKTSESFDLPEYGHQSPRTGGTESPSIKSPPLYQFRFDDKPRLKTSRSTTTLQRVKGAFEDRYGRSHGLASLPPGSPPLQSYYTPFDLGLRRPLARRFDPQRQLLRLLARAFVRWILTVLIITATIITLWVYSHEKVLRNRQKREFNAITTALLLLLNINIQSAFKQAAIFMRWKIISNRRQTLQELDLTLGIDSLVRLAKLAWVARAKPLVTLCCLAWLLLSMSVFTVVACLQFTFSLEDSTGSLVEPGQVRIVKMDHYYSKNNSAEVPSIGDEQVTAHKYGYMSSGYIQGNASDLVSSINQGNIDTGVFLTYNMVDHWAYIFYESNPSSKANFYTSRTINATWLCSGYEVIVGGDGSTADITYLDGDRQIPFFVGETGPGATTYITETAEVCGPRCARVWAYQAALARANVLPTLYDCNITISNVSNTFLPEHVIPDLQARLAAGAIGLEGFQHGNSTRQWVRYHDNDWWSSAYTNSPNDVGWLIGQFGLGTVGLMQELNPPIIVQGQLAFMGTSLVVNWKYFLLLMFALGVVQLIVFVFAVLFSNSVVVKDDSRLAIARLLRPIVERLGSAGCVLDGNDISKTLRAEVVYGVRQAGGWHHLDLGHDIKPLKLFGSFPAGWYDGEVDIEDDQQHANPPPALPSLSLPSYSPEPQSTQQSQRRQKCKTE